MTLESKSQSTALVTHSVSALLLITGSCPNCALLLGHLATLVKRGALGELCVVNVEQQPEYAAERGVRSVPWLRLGPFELSGARTLSELESWIERAKSTPGAAYYQELLDSARLEQAQRLANETGPAALVELLGDPKTPLQVRIGASAVLEGLSESRGLADALPALLSMSRHQDARIRADAAHLLGLIGDPQAQSALQQLRDDVDAEVGEIAADALAGRD